MSGIRILPEKVASQIAAGEVIERPASVLRELLDNSIDAGADRIVAKIEKGGRGLIRVSDNGTGMGRDDLLLCLERHATSKIRSFSDLSLITSLGFRGEALPSISSVSRMEITSRPSEQLVAYKLKVTGGKLKSVDETGAPAGTTVEVRDLFFNLPARRKFLRSLRTETDHVVDTFLRIALPFGGIHFKLEEGGRTILNLAASENEMNRLSGLMGRDVASSMKVIQEEVGELRIKAYLAPPDFSRARGDRLFLYVNNRNVRDRLLIRAIMEGYGQRLMKGRYPLAVFFIGVDSSLVDVNVHPTKQEIRFHNSQTVYRSVVSVLEKGLKPQVHQVFDPDREPGELRSRNADFAPARQSVMAEAGRQYPEKGVKEILPREKSFEASPLLRAGPQIIGQLKNTYILCQASDGLILIDQHAAHERIVYETVKKSFQSLHIESQSFLIPYKLELSLKEGRVVEQKLDQLRRFGLELEHFGGSTFLIRSAPTILGRVQWESFISDLIPLLEEEGDLSSEKALDKLLTVMACHGALRANHPMSREEMVALIEQLEEMNLPTNCPHGRPVFKKFSFYEIEKMFKRVV